jgi:hypothetical protein
VFCEICHCEMNGGIGRPFVRIDLSTLVNQLKSQKVYPGGVATCYMLHATCYMLHPMALGTRHYDTLAPSTWSNYMWLVVLYISRERTCKFT